jgi:hypothetical protein
MTYLLLDVPAKTVAIKINIATLPGAMKDTAKLQKVTLEDDVGRIGKFWRVQYDGPTVSYRGGASDNRK